MPKPKILVIEDERPLVEVLTYNLEREGFDVLAAYDGQDGLRQAQLKLPDLIVLDLMLPVKPGLEVCRELRTRRADPGDPDHHAHGQGRGVGPARRLRDRGRRLRDQAVQHEGADPADQEGAAPPPGGRTSRRRGRSIESQGVVIDRHRHRALFNDEELPLTPTEFRLLEVLLRQAGRAFTRYELMDAAIGEDAVVLERTIDVHVKSLRKKLGDAADLIETVRGVGYRFREPRLVES